MPSEGVPAAFFCIKKRICYNTSNSCYIILIHDVASHVLLSLEK